MDSPRQALVVVDTNVFYDALFGRDEAATSVLQHAKHGLFTPVMSERMIDELVGVCKVEFVCPCHSIGQLQRCFQWVVDFACHSRRLNPQVKVRLSPHEPDNEFIACAVEAPADYVVTRNGLHFQGNICNTAGRPVRFVSPFQFNLELLQKKHRSVS